MNIGIPFILVILTKVTKKIGIEHKKSGIIRLVVGKEDKTTRNRLKMRDK